ncbi:L-asparaginase-like isoform X2 [Limulus polyphemus]|uniref:asparaginase n=1 Tax=Limulus polyphemus TaxID=6850 RepID=A0ABM1S4U8_LIMPO|nr:L-asparaginase-like isoform X2 [Limulus polyphemus]
MEENKDLKDDEKVVAKVNPTITEGSQCNCVEVNLDSEEKECKDCIQIDPFYAPKVLRKNCSVGNLNLEGNNEARVLVLYTGGTIGMVRSEKGVYVPQSNILESNLKKFPQLHDDSYARESFPANSRKVPLVLPETGDPKRVVYTIFEYDPLLDSSNMTMDDWIHIALDIKQAYEEFDGFVILHGTDTLAYTASALSFMLENLGKTVILTGSQVTVLFNNQLFRGNRTSKISTSSLDAFGSPNLASLATVGIKIHIQWQNVFQPTTIEEFCVHDKLNRHVGLLRLFPSITVEVVRAFLMPPIRGVVLQTYGAGNGPTHRRDLLDELKRASQRGVIIVNCTQCCSGRVDPFYETGNALMDIGVVPGSDMTPEAALTKLGYVLSKSEWSHQMKRKMMQTNLRGELTVGKDIKLEDKDLITGIITAMRLSSAEEVDALRSALYPSILCTVAAKGDLEKLEIMRQFGAYLSACDYDFRTPLHIAASEGNQEIVEYLLKHGASVHMRDREHKTPLQNAVEFDYHEIIKILRKAGSHLTLPPLVLADCVINAAKRNDVRRLTSYSLAGVNLSEPDGCGRTALHVAVEMDNETVVKYLLSMDVNTESSDIYGHTPLDIAIELGREKLKDLLITNTTVF